MRRLKKIFAGAVTVAMVLSLTACGNSSLETGTSSENTDVSENGNTAEITEGEKILTVGVQAVNDQPFNPAQVTTTWSEEAAPIFDALITMDGEGNYSPGLAEDWELSDDKLTFTLNLREGVKFHDGSDFTSEDVKFTLEYYASDDSNQADKNILQQYVDSIDAPDDNTVVINFTSPCAEFEYLLSSNGTGTGLILPSDYFEEVGEEEFGLNPVGTGPFILESYTAGDTIVYTANKDYWNGAPAYNKLVIKQYAEESTRVAALQNGDIDFAPVTADSVSVIEGTDGLTVEQVPYASTLGLFLAGTYGDTGHALEDVRVREALSLAINRQEIADSIFGGNAVAAGVWGLYPFTYGYNNSRSEVSEYNPDKAISLLEEAGYPDDFTYPTITFYLQSSTVYSDDVAQALVAYWQAVGLDVQIVPVDRVELMSSVTALPIPDSYVGSIYFFNPPKKYSAYDAFAPFYPATSSLKLTQGNDELDQGIKDIIALYGTDREEKVDEVLNLIEEEEVSIPLVYPGENYAVGSRVKSFNPQASGHVGNWYYTFELN